MKMMKSEKRLCVCCMEEHEVKTVLVQEHASFKNEQISYEAMYLYCDQAEELYADEEMLKNNDIALKDAYRKKTWASDFRRDTGDSGKIWDQPKRPFCPSGMGRQNYNEI